jgi:hypothetical protein
MEYAGFARSYEPPLVFAAFAGVGRRFGGPLIIVNLDVAWGTGGGAMSEITPRTIMQSMAMMAAAAKTESTESRSGFTASFVWLYTSESGQWFLYISSDVVDKDGGSVAYGRAYGVMRKLTDLRINPFEVEQIGVNLVQRTGQLANSGDGRMYVGWVQPTGANTIWDGGLGMVGCTHLPL